MKYTPMSGVPEIEIPEMECVLGDEPDPAAYVGHLVFVAREIWRVLKQDGTFWLNLGDTYAAQRGATAMPAETLAGGMSGKGEGKTKLGRGSNSRPHRDASSYGLKHKDLVLIPVRIALALQADGWYLHNDIIWQNWQQNESKQYNRSCLHE